MRSTISHALAALRHTAWYLGWHAGFGRARRAAAEAACAALTIAPGGAAAGGRAPAVRGG